MVLIASNSSVSVFDESKVVDCSEAHDFPEKNRSEQVTKAKMNANLEANNGLEGKKALIFSAAGI